MQIKFVESVGSENLIKHAVVFYAKDSIFGRFVRHYRFKSAINNAVSLADFDGDAKEHITIHGVRHKMFDVLTIIGIGESKKLTELDYENIGGRIATITRNKSDSIVIFADFCKTASQVACLASGAMLGQYKFKPVSEAKKDNNKKKLSEIVICTAWHKQAEKIWSTRKKPVCQGAIMARDLINMPPNILNPAHFVEQIKNLEKFGIKLDILDDEELQKQGLRSMYAVGMGSCNKSYMAIMRWQGSDKKEQKPLVLIGKGVTFDSGGISLKPPAAMADMKGDMAGAAAVTGTMLALAQRKVKSDIIGIVGLVENMPSATAQRPGDVVRTYSSKTVEVLNTDAEGRLVLADIISYAKANFEPRCMIELSTLTGAIMVALGNEHAGFFTKNQNLADRLSEAGKKVGEKLWRMPLHANYDKLLESKNADMKNIGGRYAGSITAAQFLFRFAEDTDFAHIDIAGTALDSPKTPLNNGWCSGFGVRLLEQFIHEYYER